jgi:hypothetical protein
MVFSDSSINHNHSLSDDNDDHLKDEHNLSLDSTASPSDYSQRPSMELQINNNFNVGSKVCPSPVKNLNRENQNRVYPQSPALSHYSKKNNKFNTLPLSDFALKDLGTPVTEAGSPAVIEDMDEMDYEENENETVFRFGNDNSTSRQLLVNDTDSPLDSSEISRIHGSDDEDLLYRNGIFFVYFLNDFFPYFLQQINLSPQSLNISKWCRLDILMIASYFPH